MTTSISSRRALLTRGGLLLSAGLSLIAPRAARAGAWDDSAVTAAPHTKNIDTVVAFCKAGQERDLERQMSFILEDSVYHNMPDEPIVGAAKIRELLAGYTGNSEDTEIIIHNITESASGTVMTERIDRFLTKGKWIVCPVMGAAVVENGKIREWRDYYDNQALIKQMG